MKSRIVAYAALSLMVASTTQSVLAASAIEHPLTVNIKRMSLDTALRIAQASIEKCRKEGVQVTVTIVDRGGHAQVVLRDTLSMDISLSISKKKAYTAMEFNAPTSVLANRFPGAYSVPKLEALLMSAGGIPVNVGGNIIGGIGVSGAPLGETDEVCAKAGLAAALDDLEMQ